MPYTGQYTAQFGKIGRHHHILGSILARTHTQLPPRAGVEEVALLLGRRCRRGAAGLTWEAFARVCVREALEYDERYVLRPGAHQGSAGEVKEPNFYGESSQVRDGPYLAHLYRIVLFIGLCTACAVVCAPFSGSQCVCMVHVPVGGY